MATSGLSVIGAFEAALRADDDGDEDRYWELVSHLHLHGGQQALDVAGQWSTRPDAARRMVAADVAGQLGPAGGPFREGALLLLLGMMRAETDPGVLYSITCGFGHSGDERCVAPLIGLHTHPVAQVRYGVAFALLGRPEPAALDVLVTLSADEDAHVRDWATFGLARQTDADSPGLRDALAARLGDDDVDTRVEAIHGLATRGDERVIQPLRDILAAPPESADPGLLAEAEEAVNRRG